MFTWWLVWTGCVVAIDETITITEPVDRILVDISAGDVRVHSGTGPVLLMGTFGGAGDEPLSHEVNDGILTVTYGCKLCGGELTIEAPAEVALDLHLGAGDLTIDDMAGTVTADVNAGSAAVHRHGASSVDVSTNLGDAEFDFITPPPSLFVTMGTGSLDIGLPTGSYALDLDAGAGTVKIEGVSHDPESPSKITAAVGAGNIDVHSR